MNTFLRILGFVGLAGLGFISSSLVLYGSIALHIIPGMPVDAHIDNFRTYLTTSGFLWIFATFVGCFSFMMKGKKAKVLYVLPLALPLTYCILAMIHYSGFQG